MEKQIFLDTRDEFWYGNIASLTSHDDGKLSTHRCENLIKIIHMFGKVHFTALHPVLEQRSHKRLLKNLLRLFGLLASLLALALALRLCLRLGLGHGSR